MQKFPNIVAPMCLAFLLLGCDSERRLVERFRNDEESMLASYCSEDSGRAREGLIAYKAALLKWREQPATSNVVDYDFCLMVANARLFALESILGNEITAALNFSECTNQLTIKRTSMGVEPRTYSSRDVLHIVAAEDSQLSVRWREISHYKERWRQLLPSSLDQVAGTYRRKTDLIEETIELLADGNFRQNVIYRDGQHFSVSGYWRARPDRIRLSAFYRTFEAEAGRELGSSQKLEATVLLLKDGLLIVSEAGRYEFHRAK